MNKLVSHQIRFRVDPGDVPAEKAARRLHLTLEQFNDKLPKLIARGFPPADPDTGNYDLDAIDLWRKRRNPEIFGLTTLASTQQPAPERPKSPGELFAEAKAKRDAERRGRHRRPTTSR